MKEEEVLVSFDVTSLFTNVPIDKAVDVIHRKLAAEEKDDLGEDSTASGEDSRAPPVLPKVHLLQLQR